METSNVKIKRRNVELVGKSKKLIKNKAFSKKKMRQFEIKNDFYDDSVEEYDFRETWKKFL